MIDASLREAGLHGIAEALAPVIREIAQSYTAKKLSDLQSALRSVEAAATAFAPMLADETTDGRRPVPKASLRRTRRRKTSDREGPMRLVWEAVRIVTAAGRPMTAPEIHISHPMRATHDTNTLYRALSNRVGSKLVSINGAFWPADRPLPEDWQAPRPRGRRPKRSMDAVIAALPETG